MEWVIEFDFFEISRIKWKIFKRRSLPERPTTKNAFKMPQKRNIYDQSFGKEMKYHVSFHSNQTLDHSPTLYE